MNALSNYNHVALAWSSKSIDHNVVAMNVNEELYPYYAEAISDLYTWACPELITAKEFHKNQLIQDHINRFTKLVQNPWF